MKRRTFLGATALGISMLARPAFSQLDQARFVAGYPPGIGTDALARLLAERMRGSYAANCVVENRLSASGQLAVTAVKNAPADGSTVLVSPIMVLSVVPHTYAKVSLDPFVDVVPVGSSVTSDFVLAVGPAVPDSVVIVAQYVAWCRANPSKASFDTGATGTKIHFSGIRLGQLAGVKLTNIGYANGGGAVTDLAGGSLLAYIGTVPTVMPFLNRIRVLATMRARRSRFLPNVPTLVEAGYKELVVNESFGL